jgi:CheY-like chemotaxis protein
MADRLILIADPDPATARLLAPRLRQEGHTITAVKNGSRALERAILRVPDLVVFDLACGMLDWRTFRRILRANPRTEHVPVLFTATAVEQAPTSARDGFLIKPFNVDEVLARIAQVFRRSDAAQRVRRSDQGMEGAIGQLSLVDLLQVLGQSRKSGELRLTGPRGQARVWLSQGEVASAQAERARGLKAFFRLLSWREGTFSFVPGSSGNGEPGDVDKPIEELLIEGLRQSDELASVRDQLPEPEARVILLAPAEDTPADRLPVAVELVELARAGATVGELLERSRATDFAAAHVLLDLLARGRLGLAAQDPAGPPQAEPLLTLGGAHALRVSLLFGRSEGARARGKLVLAGMGTGALAGLLEQLSSIPGCHLSLDEPGSSASPFGSVGRLDVTEDLTLDLIRLPADAPSRPLWHPFSARAIGALAFAPEPDIGWPRALLTFLARDLAIPVVVAGPSALPAELEGLGPELCAVPGSPVDGLRALLQRASQRTRRAQNA